MRHEYLFPSKEKALERITALLVSDRADLPAELIEILKTQIAGTLSKYADIYPEDIRVYCDNRHKNEIEIAVPFSGYKKMQR